MTETSINQHNHLTIKLKWQIITCSFPPTPTNLKYQEPAKAAVPWDRAHTGAGNFSLCISNNISRAKSVTLPLFFFFFFLVL